MAKIPQNTELLMSLPPFIQFKNYRTLCQLLWRFNEKNIDFVVAK